jgi:hypothetical protein
LGHQNADVAAAAGSPGGESQQWHWRIPAWHYPSHGPTTKVFKIASSGQW